MELYITDNPLIYKGVDENVVRRRIIYLLPRLLILNGDFICQLEREEANEFYDNIKEDDDEYFIKKIYLSGKDICNDKYYDIFNRLDYIKEYYRILNRFDYEENKDEYNIEYLLKYYINGMKFYNELIKTLTNQLDIYRTVHLFPLKPKPLVNFDCIFIYI